jgi:hypothetical protein
VRLHCTTLHYTTLHCAAAQPLLYSYFCSSISCSHQRSMLFSLSC